METAPTVAALEPLNDKVVAELGCGTGRYTRLLARRTAGLLAIDFSLVSLERLRGKLDASMRVGLVQADVARLELAPMAFDRMLSTLHSNLPTIDHRMATMRLAAHALKDDGRYVFSMHYHGVRDFFTAAPKSGHYPGNGIYRYHMRPVEAIREAQPYFERIRCRPISVSIPGVPWLLVSRIAQRVPVLNRLGRLLLAVAERPRRAPAVDDVAVWSRRCARLLGRDLEDVAGRRSVDETPAPQRESRARTFNPPSDE